MGKKGFGISVFMICMVLLLFLIGCEFSASTANFKNIQVASDINKETNEPTVVTNTFSTDAPMIYVSGDVVNAPDGTKIKSSWVYLEMDPVFVIDEVEMTTKDIDTGFVFGLSKPDNDWPEGKYEVELYIDNNHEETVKFEVK
ncbi:hypothetical protein [Candidatus Contubernalis alkaliaceticus]|uniref:hypothetical protein n=1 Tax=Candidatus Contubernalis alkaliaceticus TaxID=338645 RepID=UPI001F4C34E9|nr:hypothetical protein [Candidatus Contubernalis alkalaceticus]UNC92442.1 hypothetical protein HUE98_10235 [Candidatus Contubernalis alkalaceticus]